MVRRYFATFRTYRSGRRFDIPTEGLYLRDMSPVELAQTSMKSMRRCLSEVFADDLFVGRRI